MFQMIVKPIVCYEDKNYILFFSFQYYVLECLGPDVPATYLMTLVLKLIFLFPTALKIEYATFLNVPRVSLFLCKDPNNLTKYIESNRP